QTHEQHQNRGAEVLSEISFADAKREGEVPEGVRDEKDYREYQQEKDAKLNEARDFILKNYSNETLLNKPGYAEIIEKFANSEELKVIIEHGFNLEELHKNGIIKTADEFLSNSKDQPSMYVTYREPLNDAKFIIDDLADACRVIDHVYDHDGSGGIGMMHDVLTAWKENDLDEVQYAFIYNSVEDKSSPLYRRLMYGAGTDSYKERTVRLIKGIPDIASEMDRWDDPGYGARILRHVYEEIETFGRRTADYEMLKDQFGESASKILWSIASELNNCFSSDPDAKELKDIYKGVLDPYNDYGIEKAKKGTILHGFDKNGEGIEVPAFTDEELIGAIYSLKNSEKIEKTAGYRLPAKYLGRHIGHLEKLGFSRESLLKIMHKNDVYVGAEEIEDMRKDGLNDTEIAYAANACKWGFCLPNGERYWVNKNFEVFSDTDLLNAALMANYDD
ncbi:MAG: hypothetical protein Q4F58_01105, partial [Candidatus Saccharibacteria bacterium]|nr:hypothetical protein [Candidatus Saccharibacteria bacterium]